MEKLEASPRDGEVGRSPSPGRDTDAGPRPDGESTPDFQDFFENAVVALHMVGGDGIILRANRAELELLGYPAEAYVGRHIAEFHVDEVAIQDILARLTRGETLQKYPARLRHRDGSIRHVEITSSAHFRNGRFQHTRCFTIDVTEREQARAEARRKDEHLRQILDALPAAVYTTDAAGRITYYNRAATELAGREPEIGRDQWCVTFRLRNRDGSNLPLDQCPMATALKENRPVRGVEALAERPDGTLVPFLPFPTPLRDETGRLTGAVNMLIDISERKQAEANQRMLLDELNHRVKNNMQTLNALLVSAQRETENAEARAVLEEASRRVSAMAAAQTLLYRDSNPDRFEAGEFLHAVTENARRTLGDEIAIRNAPAPGALSNDAAMPLALILNELLVNAAKHGCRPAGRGQGRAPGGMEIRVSLHQSSGEAVLVVEDDGPGFDPETVERRSSGLGLVSGLARQLLGDFSVETGETGGARCIVRFPDARSRG